MELSVPILLDTMDNEAEQAYYAQGGGATAVIDIDGNVQFHSSGQFGIQPAQAGETLEHLMSRSEQVYRRSFYQDPSDFLVAMVRGNEVRGWPFDELLTRPVVNDTLAEQPVLVKFDADSYSATVWSRMVDGDELSFRAAGDRIQDLQSGSHWDAVIGNAVDGPLKGRKLKQLTGIVSFRNAWLTFHPETQLWNVHDGPAEDEEMFSVDGKYRAQQIVH